MDVAVSFQRKSAFIDQQKLAPLLRRLQVVVQKRLMEECDIRLFSPALIRAVTFDLSYVMLRHRGWHVAPLLAEMTIDFLNSEYALPYPICVMLVEGMLDLLHSYSPIEVDWDAERYDQEFLEHLFIASTIAKDDNELMIDIGFGRNLLELLQAALNLGHTASKEDVFQFAPEVTVKLHKIIQEIFTEAESAPWVFDLYKLKNQLQRDHQTRKANLLRPQLERLMFILTSCSHRGNSLSAIEMALELPSLQSELALLQRAGLIFEEVQRKPKPPLYRLSSTAYALTSQRFAAEILGQQGSALQLAGLPAAYQAAILQGAWQRNPPLDFITSQSQVLSPEALKIVIETWKKLRQEQSLLELFQNLLHNRAHAWIRVEICHALPVREHTQESQVLLETLAQDDPSPMVRSAARSALKRQQKAMPSGEANPST